MASANWDFICSGSTLCDTQLQLMLTFNTHRDLVAIAKKTITLALITHIQQNV